MQASLIRMSWTSANVLSPFVGLVNAGQGHVAQGKTHRVSALWQTVRDFQQSSGMIWGLPHQIKYSRKTIRCNACVLPRLPSWGRVTVLRLELQQSSC